MSEGERPEGSAPCPRCGQPVNPGLVFCSQCGTRLAAPPSPRRALSRGLAWMLAGIILSGLSGFVFFVSCVGGGNPSGMIAAALLGLTGIATMIIGFIVALKDLRRPD